MRISARNQLKGKVAAIQEGTVNVKVTVDIGGNNKITSVITKDALTELGVEVGSEVIAVIKASTVMIGVE